MLCKIHVHLMQWMAFISKLLGKKALDVVILLFIFFLSTDSKKYLTQVNNDNKVNFDGYWGPYQMGKDDNNPVQFRETNPKFPNTRSIWVAR